MRPAFRIPGLVGFLLVACQQPSSRPPPADSKPPVQEVAHVAGDDAAPRLPEIDGGTKGAELDGDARPRQPVGTASAPTAPWLSLQVAVAAGRTSFDVDVDGKGAYSQGWGDDEPTEWHGTIDMDSVRHIEEVAKKNRFCALVDSEKTQQLMSRMTISLHGLNCYVTLSFATWKRNLRANNVYRAVRELMKRSCNDVCSHGLPED